MKVKSRRASPLDYEDEKINRYFEPGKANAQNNKQGFL